MIRKVTPKLRNRIAQRMLEDNYYKERKIISKKFEEPEKLTVQEATRIVEEEEE